MLPLNPRNGSILSRSTYFINGGSSAIIFMSTSHFWSSNRFISDICSSLLYDLFPNTLLKFIRPVTTKAFNINHSDGIELITRLRFRRSRLREDKFRHGFEDMLNPVCPFSVEVETTTHCFLHVAISLM